MSGIAEKCCSRVFLLKIGKDLASQKEITRLVEEEALS